MSKKYKEPDLSDRCADILEVCSAEQYQQTFLLNVAILLHIYISPDDMEWDEINEREKFEPADTN